MPSIASRTVSPKSEEVSLTPPVARMFPPLSGNAAPVLSTTLRCPLPFVSNVSPDNLRQYYNGGVVPQYRFNPPSPIK
jgi:hypothetical protein